MYYTYVCPQCKREITIKSNLLNGGTTESLVNVHMRKDGRGECPTELMRRKWTVPLDIQVKGKR